MVRPQPTPYDPLALCLQRAINNPIAQRVQSAFHERLDGKYR
ncbi:DUF1654 domain-containing protein [Pseudomonas luteola]|nr:DUF1654 domain-containing protein [Pseudomonas luteola]